MTEEGTALEKVQLAFIGAGQMTEALVKGILDAKVLRPEQIILSDIRSSRLSQLKESYGVRVTSSNLEAVKQASVALCAVKPQNMDEVLEEIRDCLSEDQLLISIVAGVTTESIYNHVKKKVPVVRVMPNNPALIGWGMAAVSGGEHATSENVKLVRKLLSSVGEVVELEEEYLNQVTALSGSGPAYFYFLVECLIEAGIESGLKPEIAEKLVTQTAAGAGVMLKKAGRSPMDLREMVTSPGGTTAAALKVFEEANFKEVVKEAVKAAVKRANELS